MFNSICLKVTHLSSVDTIEEKLNFIFVAHLNDSLGGISY